MVGIESYTLRYYESIGLVQPYRSKGNIRYYSEADIERLRHVKALMDHLGLNLAGAEVVIRMAEKMGEMQKRIEDMESELEQLRGSEARGKSSRKKKVSNAEN